MGWEGPMVLCLFCAVLGALMSEHRGRGKVGGFLVGFGLGPIGLALVALLMRPKPVTTGRPR